MRRIDDFSGTLSLTLRAVSFRALSHAWKWPKFSECDVRVHHSWFCGMSWTIWWIHLSWLKCYAQQRRLHPDIDSKMERNSKSQKIQCGWVRDFMDLTMIFFFESTTNSLLISLQGGVPRCHFRITQTKKCAVNIKRSIVMEDILDGDVSVKRKKAVPSSAIHLVCVLVLLFFITVKITENFRVKNIWCQSKSPFPPRNGRFQTTNAAEARNNCATYIANHVRTELILKIRKENCVELRRYSQEVQKWPYFGLFWKKGKLQNPNVWDSIVR